MRNQRTVAGSISFSGIGVHTGNKTELTFQPAEENSGIRFIRTDLPGRPEVKAHITNVVGFIRGTTIGQNNVNVHTVEHVMAALCAFGITNLTIELDGNEPPVGDGSSLPFVKMLQETGIVEQKKPVEIFSPHDPLFIREEDIILVVLPYDRLKISYTLSFPHPRLKAQYLSLDITQDSFVNEIASSRTFCLYHEVEMLMDQGLIKGGSLDNAVVIGDKAIFSREELRFHDEFVRHKMLDLIGDTYLLGMPFNAHIVAIKSGHATNSRLTRVLYEAYLKQSKLVNAASH
ncbi:UDP-3-O-[3-hydroxymyristoyl] N-acetylglucosamine deacetylase [bacterium]|nr:UDP-3-O-[3-hydroxymyristoyl] N-acetylglucosamine deacetylase [bacterium]MCP5462793.1 UDP-3-O-[3-hydroxymyristoyl] N-acetylglucosamine deacetylase [bacterium]